MALEIEAKFQVDAHHPVQARLQAAGAVPLGRVIETNHIFDDAGGRLRKGGAALRVRALEPLDGGQADTTLTFKGPVLPGHLKRRTEIEVSVAQAPAMLELLAALGFVEVMVYRKRRESHRLGRCRVELDELPWLGLFVEIEGPDEQTIGRVQQDLGLADCAHLPESYVGLLAAHCARAGRDCRRIDFPNP